MRKSTLSSLLRKKKSVNKDIVPKKDLTKRIRTEQNTVEEKEAGNLKRVGHVESKAWQSDPQREAGHLLNQSRDSLVVGVGNLGTVDEHEGSRLATEVKNKKELSKSKCL